MTFHCIWLSKIMKFWKNLSPVIQMVEVEIFSVMLFITVGGISSCWFPQHGIQHNNIHGQNPLNNSLLSFQLKEVLVPPQQSIMASENTFHSTSSICRLNEPILQLKKETRAVHTKEQLIPEGILDIPEGSMSMQIMSTYVTFAIMHNTTQTVFCN